MSIVNPHIAPPESRPPSPPTLEAIANEELTLTGGNREEAVAAMMQRLLDDEVLREALVAPIIHQVCVQKIGAIIRSRRTHIWNPPPPPAGLEHVKITAAVNRLSLMNFPLPSGKRLGDATGREVREAAKFYLKQGSDMMVKHRWLAAVADAVPAAKVVSHVLKVRQLKALRAKAERV